MQADHHPDISINYSRVKMTLSTHSDGESNHSTGNSDFFQSWYDRDGLVRCLSAVRQRTLKDDPS
jgi:Pterin 4 alpha carbinolamine dehydratase